MKKFVAILKEKKRGKLKDSLLYEHVDHLRELDKRGKLLICGPFQDNDQAMQILIGNSLEEATKLVENDPFIREGYYGSYEINELIEANEANNWLV